MSERERERERKRERDRQTALPQTGDTEIMAGGDLVHSGRSLDVDLEPSHASQPQGACVLLLCHHLAPSCVSL